MNKLVLLFISCYSLSYSQNGPVAAGTSTTGAGGSVSYSIGQIDYIAPTGSGGNNNEGLQQPYELFVIATSLKKNEKLIAVNVFPNPVSNSITIDLKDPNFQNYSYQLTDVNGKIISENKITEAQSKVNVSDLSAGTYFIHISNSTSSLNTYKLIKH